MTSKSVQQHISLMITAKRREMGNLGVRQAAKAAGISAATFSRLGRGLSTALPDVATLTKLANWLGVSVGELLGSNPISESTLHQNTIPEIVEVHLRADKNLSPETANALAEMFKSLYKEFTGRDTRN
jgi:transcriptional regulator with XRE-family HTH domain